MIWTWNQYRGFCQSGGIAGKRHLMWSTSSILVPGSFLFVRLSWLRDLECETAFILSGLNIGFWFGEIIIIIIIISTSLPWLNNSIIQKSLIAGSIASTDGFRFAWLACCESIRNCDIFWEPHWNMLQNASRKPPHFIYTRNLHR